MRQIYSRCILIFYGLILLSSFLIFSINYFVDQFPGNNYFPENALLIFLLLIFFNLGLRLCFEKNNKLCHMGLELLYFLCVMSAIALMTNAIQLTPFPVIDSHIVRFEERIHINMISIIKWADLYPQFKSLLWVIYNSLPNQMSIIPLLVILTGRFHLLREYYFFLLCTTLLGFLFYYFFPTTAPASIFDHSLFTSEQIATGLKFQQIHQHINPTNNAGGLIALPSFHVIWALLCVNLIREWLIPFILLSIINILLIASCILLGWHYCTDIIGSFVVLLISYCLLKQCKKTKALS